MAGPDRLGQPFLRTRDADHDANGVPALPAADRLRQCCGPAGDPSVWSQASVRAPV